MTSERHKQISALFRKVCDREPAEREKILARAGASDPELRAAVEALLARDGEEADAFGEAGLGVGTVLLGLDARATESPTQRDDGPEPMPHGQFLPGAMVGQRYRIVSLLGRGGMGEVYRADDVKLGEAVALKFLPARLAENPRLLELLHDEARISRQIAHPNVCRTHDIGEVDGQHFMSMEYVDGETLRQLLRRIGPLPRDKSIDIARQICRGLAAAHENGVLHRDLKPGNVMIDGRGRVRITDFGVAQLMGTPRARRELSGTLAYMSPEQIERGETTVRSDLYSLGLVLHELFTGRMVSNPRAGRSSTTVATAAGSLIRDIDSDVERAIFSCLERDPADRPQSALAVAAALPGGGEVLEAAIAAGETPSPETIFAAGEGKGLTARAAAAALLAAWIGIVVCGVLSLRTQESIGFDPAAVVQPDRARDLMRELGLEWPGADATWGLSWNPDYFSHFTANRESRERWAALTGDPPTAAVFWYRQAPTDLVPLQGRGPFLSMLVTRDDPPPNAQGMVNLVLDANGKLLELEAPAHDRGAPTRRDTAADSSDSVLERVLRAAGIELEEFERAFAASRDPGEPPSSYASSWQAWDSRVGSVRIEAAAFGGRPVWFRVAPRLESPPDVAPHLLGVILSITVLTLLGSSLFLARRNWRSGRADRKGAWRLFKFIVIISVLSWALQAHHVTGTSELAMILATVARALLRAAVICAAYVGLEPHVRRLWPQTLVGWSRLLAGRVRDPVVGRDALLGILGGVAFQLVGSAGMLVGLSRHLTVTADPIVRLGVGPLSLEPLLGVPTAAGQVLQEVFVGVVGGLVVCLLFVFVLRVALRRSSFAVAAFALFFAVPALSRGDVLGAIVVALWASTGLVLLFRFGVLAVAVAWLSWRVLAWPIAWDLSSPQVDLGLLARGALAALAGLAAFAATRIRRMGRQGQVA